MNGTVQTFEDSANATFSTNLTGYYLLGALLDGTYQHRLDGDIAELLIYGSSLTTNERSAIEGYLNAKYAIY